MGRMRSSRCIEIPSAAAAARDVKWSDGRRAAEVLLRELDPRVLLGTRGLLREGGERPGRADVIVKVAMSAVAERNQLGLDRLDAVAVAARMVRDEATGAAVPRDDPSKAPHPEDAPLVLVPIHLVEYRAKSERLQL